MRNTLEIHKKRVIKPYYLPLVTTCFFSSMAHCEITLDGSMGSTGALPGPYYQISEDLGQRAGNNLFHSFGQFNLNNTESATFSGSAGIQNVISRVTGGQVSNIDGALRSTIPDANVFFLNPAGVIFGENASLDVQGSFHASTADYLKFKDGVHFDTGGATANPLLTTAAPEAFGFLDDSPAGISVSGGTNKILEVPENSTLSLVGGDITINDRSLYAPGGQVILASVGSAGEVVINESGIETTSFTRGGNIHISHSTNNPTLTIEEDKQIADIDVSADSSGRVLIRGGQMVMDNSYIWSDTTNGQGGGIDIGLTGDLTVNGVPETAESDSTPTSGITSDVLGNGQAGNIDLDVNQLKLTHATRIESKSIASGNGGDLNINTHTIVLEGNDTHAVPKLVTATTSTGNAGDIAINNTSELEVSKGAYIRTYTSAEGNSGDISINTGSLTLHDKAQINSKVTKSAEGWSGDLTINATDSIDIYNNAIIANNTDGKGNAGGLNINTGSLTIIDSKFLTSTSGEGDSGDLVIKANSVDISTNGTISNSSDNTGTSGDLTITAADSIKIHDNGIILNSADNQGNSGQLTVAASDSIAMSNNGIILSNTNNEANTGDLIINTDSLNISDSPISSITEGSENGSNITIATNNLKVINGGRIASHVSEEATGNGGDINVEATGTISLSGFFGGITSLTNSDGNSGNIAVTSKNLEIRNGSWINTGTTSSGTSGDLSVHANEIVLKNDVIMPFGDSGGLLPTGISSHILDINMKGTATGNSGSLTVKADNLLVSNGANISTSNGGQGNSGSLLVDSGKILLTTDFDSDTDISIDRGGIQANILNGITGNSGDLTVNSNDLIVENGAEISTSNFGSGNSGNLLVNSKNISLSGNNDLHITGIFNKNFRTGKLGELSLNTENLDIQNGASISAETFGEGNGGDLSITSQSMLLSGINTNISTESSFIGNAGNISINTNNLKMVDGASVSTNTYGFGLGGYLNILSSSIFLSGNETSLSTASAQTSSRNAGNLTVTSDHLDMRAGASINSSTHSQGVNAYTDMIEANPEGFKHLDLTVLPIVEYQNSFGNGGEVKVNASHINISDQAIINASTYGKGEGGNLEINAKTILIEGDTSNFLTGIANQADGDHTGNAGNLTIITDSLELRNDARISASTFGSGQAGDLVIKADDILLNFSKIQSSSIWNDIQEISEISDIGKSGNISITTNDRLRLENNSEITVSTKKANAGGIEINGGNILQLSNNSGILTSVSNGSGGGGDISIATPLVALDDSSIRAQAIKGAGGNITIAGFVFQSPGSLVDASSELSTDGELNLKPDTNISGSIAVLPDNLLNASRHISDRCAARSMEKMSSFIVTGRGGRPARPGELSPSNVFDYLPNNENPSNDSINENFM